MTTGRPPRDQGERFWEKVNKGKPDECWEWKSGLTTYGYGKFKAKINGHWISMNAHRFAWLLTHGIIPCGLDVCHTCDNRKCCNLDHLFLGTKAQNTEDMIQKGRKPRGEKSGNAKLTEMQIIAIREEYKLCATSWSKLAKKYNVTKRNIGNIIQRKSWKCVNYPDCKGTLNIGEDGKPETDEEAWNEL